MTLSFGVSHKLSSSFRATQQVNGGGCAITISLVVVVHIKLAQVIVK